VCADLYFDWFLLLYVACILSVCHCLFSDYAKTVSVENGWPAISVCFAGNPPHVVYFNCSLLSVIWRMKYYYYYRTRQQRSPWKHITDFGRRMLRNAQQLNPLVFIHSESAHMHNASARLVTEFWAGQQGGGPRLLLSLNNSRLL